MSINRKPTRQTTPLKKSPHPSMKPKKPGKPSFKQGVKCTWKKRMVELPESFIEELGILKVKGEIDGLDHAIFLALKEKFELKL